MKATISLDNILTSLFGLSTRNQKWIADKLYQNVASIEKKKSEEEAMLFADLQEAIADMKAGRIRPAEELLEELRNGNY